MNTVTKPITASRRATLAAAVATAVLLAGCSSAPSSPPGAADVRAKLTRLQSDSNLAGRVPSAQQDAEQAVRLAEQPLKDSKALGAHRVYLADRKVEIAMARSTTSYTEAQRATLTAEQTEARLDARTREANAAQREAERSRQQAYSARDEADRAQRDANLARGDASQARSDAANRDAARDASLRASQQETERLQRQIRELEAEKTSRGLVLTLGDVLFGTGRSELRDDAISNLDRLAAFLKEYPTRNLEIEGHTDAVGAASYNQGLSERRAASVKAYLVRAGIASERMSVLGKGLESPRVANAADGSQPLNRRVEVIILEPGIALPMASRAD
jgi:outer membrane protein OmpA-like peptidoglycan-associated protein